MRVGVVSNTIRYTYALIVHDRSRLQFASHPHKAHRLHSTQDENRLPRETHLDALTISINRLKRRNWTRH